MFNSSKIGRPQSCSGSLVLALAITLALWPGIAQAKRVSTQHPPASEVAANAAKRHSRVTLLRGGYTIFSGGLDQLGNRLAGLGIEAEVTNYGSWRRIVREIVADRKDHGRRPLALIGHSTGANTVILMARALAEEGIAVDYIATFAATSPSPVPWNVRHVVNYYFETRGWGLPLKAGRGFRGTLENKDVSKSGGVDHFNIDENTEYQEEVLHDVAGIVSN